MSAGQFQPTAGKPDGRYDYEVGVTICSFRAYRDQVIANLAHELKQRRLDDDETPAELHTLGDLIVREQAGSDNCATLPDGTPNLYAVKFERDYLNHCPMFLTLDDALDFVRRVRIDNALKAAA